MLSCRRGCHLKFSSTFWKVLLPHHHSDIENIEQHDGHGQNKGSLSYGHPTRKLWGLILAALIPNSPFISIDFGSIIGYKSAMLPLDISWNPYPRNQKTSQNLIVSMNKFYLQKNVLYLSQLLPKFPWCRGQMHFIDKSLQILLSTGWVPGLLVSIILFCYRLLKLPTACEGSVNNPKQAVKHPWNTREAPVKHPWTTWTTRESPVNHPWYIREPFVRRVC